MELRKRIGLLELFCFASGAMISSGLFILPALAYSKAGPAIILSYIIASLLFLPALMSLAELTTAMPKTGCVHYYTARSMGPLAGTLGGFSAWFSVAFKSAFAMLGIGILVSLFNPGLTLFQIRFIAALGCLIVMGVNLAETYIAGKLQTLMVLIVMSLLSFYILVGLPTVDVNNYQSQLHFGTILSTAGFVIVSYAGIKNIACIAGEVKNPARNIPLAIFLSWFVVTLLYILVILVTIGVLAPREITETVAYEGHSVPIATGGEAILGPLGILIIIVAALIAHFSTGNSGVFAASRDPMAMGRDELLPKIFGKVSKRGVPSIISTS